MKHNIPLIEPVRQLCKYHSYYFATSHYSIVLSKDERVT